MKKMRVFRSGVFVGSLIFVLAAFLCPETVLAYGSGAPATGGTLSGKIIMGGTRGAVGGAVVKLRNLNNQKEFIGKPSAPNGVYVVADIEEGWYTVGITTPAGDYNLSYGIYIKGGEKAKLSMELKEGGNIEGKGMRAGNSFFKTPAGIATIILATGGVAFGVYELTKNEKETSEVK